LYKEAYEKSLKDIHAGKQENVKNLVSKLHTSVIESNKALKQIANDILGIFQNSNQSISKIIEATTGISESVKFSKTVVTASKKTSTKSMQLKNTVEREFNNVNKVIRYISDIEKTIKDFMDIIEKLNGSYKEIENITVAIKKLSDQSNLLALNAAIEAARAGDQGKGFGVVSDEIKKLSNESKNSADNISNLIKKNTKKMINILKDSKNITKLVNTSANDATSIGNSINTLISDINDVINKINQIDKTIVKQSSIMEDTVEDINSIALISSETNMSTKEINIKIQEQLNIRNQIEDMISEVAKIVN
jgi:methyl-accepting chemotaxis protein